MIARLEQTCFACPSQWEGELTDGRCFYIRFRWGYLSISFGETVTDAIRADETFGAQLSDGMDGVISWSEVEPHFIKAAAVA